MAVFIEGDKKCQSLLGRGVDLSNPLNVVHSHHASDHPLLLRVDKDLDDNHSAIALTTPRITRARVSDPKQRLRGNFGPI
tara:strand:- start:218 stop:457 length:240 start_codon:yes stop_codon:yes gene_type:complete